MRSLLALGTILLGGVFGLTHLLQAADQPINLDESSVNGDESRVSTKVLQTYPVKIENTVYNNAAGEAFNFFWPGAGPGGFSSFVSAGPGVGTIWTWTTVYQVYSIDSPITFAPVRTLPVFGAPSTGVQGPVASEGNFLVTGKSLSPSSVTLSSASLTSSLITFFSPEKTVASCGVDCGAGNCELFLENQTGETVTLAAEQQDCCYEPDQLICDGVCTSYLTDEQNCGACGNVCAFDEFCGNGICEEICPGQAYCDGVCLDVSADPLNCGACGNVCGADEYCGGGTCNLICDLTVCGEACVDVSSDPLNCGACGNVCPENNICTGGVCQRCRPPKGTACNNVCVSLNTDPYNCGACGNVCDFSGCPSEGQGTCSSGQSCQCSPSGTATTTELSFRPTPSVTSHRLLLSSSSRSPRRTAGSPEVAASILPPAPVCDLAPISQVVPDGGRFTQSQAGGRFGKEIQTTITIVKDGQVVAQGPCALIVPVTGVDTSGVILSPVSVATRDASGDNLCQPGEAWCEFLISVSNVGDSACLNPFATLSSPPDQHNPNQVTFLNAASAYPGISSYPGDGQTLPLSTNTTAFSITAPADQAPDVGRTFLLSVNCTNRPDPVVMPLTLGIGSSCNPNAINGESYDSLTGFTSPVNARLTNGGPVQYSTGSFNSGKTIPLKLTLGCGGLTLTDAQINPNPEIVSLVHATLGSLPLTGINGDNNANPDDPEFSCSETGCDYQFRTAGLPVGTYVIGVKLPDSRVFQAGFTIRP